MMLPPPDDEFDDDDFVNGSSSSGSSMQYRYSSPPRVHDDHEEEEAGGTEGTGLHRGGDDDDDNENVRTLVVAHNNVVTSCSVIAGLMPSQVVGDQARMRYVSSMSRARLVSAHVPLSFPEARSAATRLQRDAAASNSSSSLMMRMHKKKKMGAADAFALASRIKTVDMTTKNARPLARLVDKALHKCDLLCSTCYHLDDEECDDDDAKNHAAALHQDAADATTTTTASDDGTCAAITASTTTSSSSSSKYNNNNNTITKKYSCAVALQQSRIVMNHVSEQTSTAQQLLDTLVASSPSELLLCVGKCRQLHALMEFAPGDIRHNMQRDFDASSTALVDPSVCGAWDVRSLLLLQALSIVRHPMCIECQQDPHAALSNRQRLLNDRLEREPCTACGQHGASASVMEAIDLRRDACFVENQPYKSYVGDGKIDVHHFPTDVFSTEMLPHYSVLCRRCTDLHFLTTTSSISTFLIETKRKMGQCADCALSVEVHTDPMEQIVQNDNHKLLQFDHVHPAEKMINIGMTAMLHHRHYFGHGGQYQSMIRRLGVRVDDDDDAPTRMLRCELAKTRLLCIACHEMRTRSAASSLIIKKNGGNDDDERRCSRSSSSSFSFASSSSAASSERFSSTSSSSSSSSSFS